MATPSPTPSAPAPAAEAASAAGAQEAASATAAAPRWRRPMRFLRAFLKALVEEETYDLKGNPTLWVGFLMALPIPLLTVTAHAPAWLVLLSIPAPLFWAVVVGATGRVGIKAELAAQKLQKEVEAARSQARAQKASLETALGQEVSRRRRLERREQEVLNELKIAAAVHRTLLPNSIQRPDVEVAIRQIPTEIVGGDYLYAAIAADRWLYLAIGDVTGHGVSAALVVSRIHGLMRRVTLALKSRPLTILEKINNATLDIFQHTWFFMTMAVFRLDLETGYLRYATAGHPEQVLLRKDGTIELLRTPNRLLGIDADIFDGQRPSDAVQLQPGDSLVLFTDGLFEIPSGQGGPMLGEQGLHERIASVNGLSPALMAGEILQDLADFQGSSAFDDDVSLMVATWKGPVGEEHAGAGI